MATGPAARSSAPGSAPSPATRSPRTAAAPATTSPDSPAALPFPSKTGEGDRAPQRAWWRGKAPGSADAALPLHPPLFGGRSPSPAARERKLFQAHPTCAVEVGGVVRPAGDA